jgi:hypothetical protein
MTVLYSWQVRVEAATFEFLEVVHLFHRNPASLKYSLVPCDLL